MQRPSVSHFARWNNLNNMINLLPISGIKRIISEYRVRLITTALIMLATTMIIALVLLFPAYLLASHKRDLISENLSKMGDQATSTQEVKNLEKIIKETDVTIDTLGGKGQKFSVSSDILLKTSGYRTENIKIIGIFYDKKDTNGALSFKGSAGSRQNLTEFVDLLKKDPAFTDVSLPISDLVKDKNIDFTIILKLKGDKDTTRNKPSPEVPLQNNNE